MNIQSALRSLAGLLLAMAAGFIVAACGGGGASQSTGSAQGGIPIMQPNGATFYAGVPNTITITGGRRPYTLTSSEPSLMPVPQTVNGGSFEVIPANPGVIDTGLPPDALPVRTVNLTLRDASGQTAAMSVKVAVNFLTGYGVSFKSNCPSAGAAANAPAACAGGETVVSIIDTTNGNLHGNRPVRFEVIRGPLSFVQLPNTTVVGNTYTTTTDHAGAAFAILRVNANVPSQVGVIRVVDVATGAYVDFVIPISASGPQSTLTAIPDKFTFTGALSTVCGTGSGDFLVFGGQPPYTAFSSDPNIRVTPSSTSANPGQFTVTATNPNVCVTGATIVVTDATGARATVTVDTAKGTTDPTPPPPLTVAPTSITLACGTSGSVTVVGGVSGGYFVNSTHPRVTAVVSGNTITITRLSGDAAGQSFPTTASISVSDGRTIVPVGVTVPANCP